MILFQLSASTMSYARITWGYTFIIATVPLRYMDGDNDKLVYLQKSALSLSLFVYDSVVQTTIWIPSWQTKKLDPVMF